VWCARGGVRTVMFARCAVVAAVRDVVRACGACVLVCCMRECNVGVACRWALCARRCALVSHALDLRKWEESWLRHMPVRDVRCASWACITGAVSSTVSGVLCRSIAIADLCCRVCVAAPRLAVACVRPRSAAWDCVSG
jgi:hypothetical protein